MATLSPYAGASGGNLNWPGPAATAPTPYFCAIVLVTGGQVISLLEESLAISGELGMRPLLERALAAKERAESLPSRAPAYPDGLSPREVEVLRLISAGKSNRDIAEELIISQRTVANHVTNILNKTNAANRTEAATYASRHQLV